MMKFRTKRLKKYVTVYLGGLTLVLVLLYSILLNKYLIMGLDEASGRDIRLAAKELAEKIRKNPEAPLPDFPRLKVYIGIKSLPGWVFDEFDQPFEDGRLMVGHYDKEPDESGREFHHHGLALLYPYDLPDGRRLFLLKTYTGEECSGGIDLKMMKIVSWPIGLLSIIIFISALRFMMRKLEKPVEDMEAWALNLDSSKLDEPHPDFVFDEINHLAGLIQKSMKELDSTLERERRFLRNASHELRTPIAVASSNLELLERIRKEPCEDEKAVLARINRAVENMRKLTMAMLWLGRKDETLPPPESVMVDRLINELVNENIYLTKGKSLNIKTDAKPLEIKTNGAACQIVLNNLIRNAFQYADQGVVYISSDSDKVIIENHISQDECQGSCDYGFGLGLAIVNEVVEKMGWEYGSEESEGVRKVYLKFM